VILKRARIKNFRSIRDADVQLGPHIAILGGNGAGKSTVLRAIERFYAPSTTIELGREPINLPCRRLVSVRYAPIATKFRGAAK